VVIAVGRDHFADWIKFAGGMSVRLGCERDGKGLSHLIGRALDADIPVVIAVGRDHFADWIKFAGGMSVRLGCESDALEAWWRSISTSNARHDVGSHPTVCEILK